MPRVLDERQNARSLENLYMLSSVDECHGNITKRVKGLGSALLLLFFKTTFFLLFLFVSIDHKHTGTSV